MTDEQIIHLIQNESTRESGFRQLMNRYQEMLYQHIRRMVRDHEDTNDVLQNTFLKVFKYIGNFEGRSNLYTWIYRIATNEALTHLSKSKKLSIVQVNDDNSNPMENIAIADNGPTPETIGKILLAALETLPDKQKSVFSLRYYDEMSYKQISEVLGTSEGALKASFHHAVKKLERFFKNANIY